MKLSLKILIHFIYWSVFLAFTVMFGKSYVAGNWPTFNDISTHVVLNLIWAAVIFYFFYFYLIRFFKEKKFIKYLLLSIISSVIVTFIFLPTHKLFAQFRVFDYRFFVPPMVGTFVIGQCGCLVRGFENWFTDVQVKK